MQASVRGIRREVKHIFHGVGWVVRTYRVAPSTKTSLILIHVLLLHHSYHFLFILKNHKQEMAVLLLPHIITKSTQSVLPFSTSHTTHKIREVSTSLSSLRNRTSVCFNYGELLDFHIRWKSPRYLVSWVSNHYNSSVGARNLRHSMYIHCVTSVAHERI